MNRKAPAIMILKIYYCPGAFPVTGSVPRALLNKRMCGSGLRNYENITLGGESAAALLVNGVVIPSAALLHTQAAYNNELEARNKEASKSE